MARTKRAQILMDPDEYRRLEEIAYRERRSVADLIREAVRERYLVGGERRRELMQELLSMQVELDGDWEQWEREAQERADGGMT